MGTQLVIMTLGMLVVVVLLQLLMKIIPFN